MNLTAIKAAAEAHGIPEDTVDHAAANLADIQGRYADALAFAPAALDGVVAAEPYKDQPSDEAKVWAVLQQDFPNHVGDVACPQT